MSTYTIWCSASNPSWISCLNSNYLYFGILAADVTKQKDDVKDRKGMAAN
jgi:hypothetical protein